MLREFENGMQIAWELHRAAVTGVGLPPRRRAQADAWLQSQQHVHTASHGTSAEQATCNRIQGKADLDMHEGK